MEKGILSCARNLHSQNLGLVNAFSLMAERGPGDALQFLARRDTFRNPELLRILENMPQVARAAAEAYASRLNKWEADCLETWATGKCAYDFQVAKEYEAYQTFVDMQHACIASLQRKIRTNGKRIGLRLSMG
jgi:hypothetical protein